MATLLEHRGILVAAVALAVAGCAGDDRDPIAEVEYGMTTQRVAEIMGAPDRTEKGPPEQQCWLWGGSKDRGPHSAVCFTSGEVSLIVLSPDPNG